MGGRIAIHSSLIIECESQNKLGMDSLHLLGKRREGVAYGLARCVYACIAKRTGRVRSYKHANLNGAASKIAGMSAVASIHLANPRGFCAGVDRAIEIVKQVLKRHGTPIYVKHEIVHNHTIVADFKRQGVVFIEDPSEVPAGAILVYSAHGVSRATRTAAEARGLTIYDATCPLVTKVHAEVNRMCQAGYEIIMIGHKGHPEVEGTVGQAEDAIHLVENEADAQALQVRNPDKLAYVTQTTLSVDDTAHLVRLLRARFPKMVAPAKDDICYATQNRQDAVKALAAQCDVIFVIGSQTSSNSNRLCEVAAGKGVQAYLIDHADDIQPQWLANRPRIGVSAGASAPEHLVQELIAHLQTLNPQASISEVAGREENITFSIPKKLRKSISQF